MADDRLRVTVSCFVALLLHFCSFWSCLCLPSLCLWFRAFGLCVVVLRSDLGSWVFQTVLGSFVLGSCVLGSCVLGSCVLGSCGLGSCVLGSCVLGSCVFGSYVLGSCVLGSFVFGSCVLGSCVLGSVGCGLALGYSLTFSLNL